MKIDTGIFRSKVSLRIFLLFVVCALLPITVLTLLSLFQVNTQLEKQSQKQLHQDALALGITFYDRLMLVEAEMKRVSSFMVQKAGSPREIISDNVYESRQQLFKSLSIIRSGKSEEIIGESIENLQINPAQKKYLSTGGTLVFTAARKDLETSVYMSVYLDPKNPSKGRLLSEINPAYLWGLDEGEMPLEMTEVCILDQSRNVLFSSLKQERLAALLRMVPTDRKNPGYFTWKSNGTGYLANSSVVFLESRFFSDMWTVIMSEPKSHVQAPLAKFKKIFLQVTILSLFVVLLLSTRQIRKSMIPLERLREGTQRIAERKFNTTIEVKSNDEFEELAGSFNTMASELNRHFKALKTMSSIDRAILSVLNTDKVVDTFLMRIGEIFTCDAAGVCLMDTYTENLWHSFTRMSTLIADKQAEDIVMGDRLLKIYYDNPDHLLLSSKENLPPFLKSLAKQEMRSFLVMPVFVKNQLTAITILAHKFPPKFSQEDLAQTRQLANRLALALSNANLINELNQLNWGTLTALARTVDAKSHWTSGHSERVSKMAISIGNILGLSSEELDDLRKAALLHDIGKISTPKNILDKQGKLTQQEYDQIKKHPWQGARILEPITQYSQMIPIVLQHHERFDGNGYPNGAFGNEIVFGARVLSIADTFDAMTSDRPYRKGMDVGRVVREIKEQSDRQFDPDIVKAFLEAISEKWKHASNE